MGFFCQKKPLFVPQKVFFSKIPLFVPEGFFLAKKNMYLPPQNVGFCQNNLFATPKSFFFLPKPPYLPHKKGFFFPKLPYLPPKVDFFFFLPKNLIYRPPKFFVLPKPPYFPPDKGFFSQKPLFCPRSPAAGGFRGWRGRFIPAPSSALVSAPPGAGTDRGGGTRPVIFGGVAGKAVLCRHSPRFSASRDVTPRITQRVTSPGAPARARRGEAGGGAGLLWARRRGGAGCAVTSGAAR